MEQPNWTKRFYEWSRNIYLSISDVFYDGKTGFSLEDIKRKKEEYAEEFSEGNNSLKNLLCHLWDNNIETMACCAGHAYGAHYEKNTLFGRIEVSESVAMKAKEKNKKGYYRVEEFSYPYLMFKCPENCQAVSKDIKKNLDKQGLSFNCSVTWDDWERISIHYEGFGPGKENIADRFFSAVCIAMDQVLGIGEKELKKATMEKTSQPLKETSNVKRSLSEQLLDAAKRRASIGTGYISAKQKETQFYR